MTAAATILLDTHIWVWWVHGDPRLSARHAETIRQHEDGTIGVSAISCWEVAKLVQVGRLTLAVPLSEWMERALAYPGIRLIELTPEIAVESTQLPGNFHKDPADQIIVATARRLGSPLLTVDSKIQSYSGVQVVPA